MSIPTKLYYCAACDVAWEFNEGICCWSCGKMESDERYQFNESLTIMTKEEKMRKDAHPIDNIGGELYGVSGFMEAIQLSMLGEIDG